MSVPTHWIFVVCLVWMSPSHVIPDEVEACQAVEKTDPLVLQEGGWSVLLNRIRFMINVPMFFFG